MAKRYGRKTVLDAIDVAFPVGLTLLAGPSGAGKSTLLRLLATAGRSSTGAITWDGVPLPASRRALRATLGYAPQAVDLPDDLTAREFARHVAALKGLKPRGAGAQFLDLAASLGLHGDVHRPIGVFSGGMRRRLVFAQALLGAPRLIALDEPTAELDIESAAAVNALLFARAKDAVIVMTTHFADALVNCARQRLRVADGRVGPA